MPYRVDARLTGRHPFQEYAVTISAIVGFLFSVQIVTLPPSMLQLLPRWGVIVWAWVLFLSATAAAVAVFLKDRSTGLILEQLGLFVLGLATILFAGALFVVNGQAAALVGGLIGGFGASCLRRGWQIQRVLDQVHAVEKQNKKG